MTLTASQYPVLLAMSRGAPYTLWPAMRKALIHAGYIVASGPRIAPADERRPRTPVRPFDVTEAGRAELAAYTGEVRPARPAPVVMKPQNLARVKP